MTPLRSTLYRCGTGLGGAVVLAMGLTACGSGSSAGAASATASTSASSSLAAPTSSVSSQSGDAPIGSGDIDLGGGSTTSYPPSMLSQDLATDCYSGEDRIYDRHGVTCADARTLLTAYEASAESASGREKAVQKYTCSHNPSIMVNQGAAPGKCVDNAGNVVFNWRYPGAPLPAR